MQRSHRLLALVLASLLLPMVTLAQQDDLRATIRAEIMKDPRAAQMSRAQIESLVNQLAQGAEAQGMTSYDITWRPSQSAIQSAPTSNQFCDGLPSFICAVNSGFGFDGSNTFIPVALFITSGLLWFLLYELKHHHKHDEMLAKASVMPQQ